VKKTPVIFKKLEKGAKRPKTFPPLEKKGNLGKSPPPPRTILFF